jgi:penicillin-binding protein 1A
MPKLHIPRLSTPLLVGAAVIGITVAGVAGSWWYSCGFDACPSVDQLRAWQPTEGGMLLDRSGVIIAPLAPVKRVNVAITRVPAHVQAAFIAVEDKRFRTHHGIDWYGVARALVRNVIAGGVREGASTITMQLSRNVFLAHRAAERSVTRKLLEVRYARLLESALSKDEILERYLNAIYLGNGVYGVEGASRDLFGKSVRSLTLAEAAMLAGLPKAPSGYSPRHDTDRAQARRAVVLGILEREGVATSAAVAVARNAPIEPPASEWEPHVLESWSVEAVRPVLDSLRKAGVIPAVLNDGQLRVRTSFDRRAQLAAERAVASGAAQVDAAGGGGRTQGALVAIDPGTGAIRAIVGGRRMERRGFNRAYRATRQPGSAFKPFVYAAALQQGYTAATMVDDEPIEIDVGRDVWSPANFDGSYAGRITLQDALARSSNAATVRVSRDVGIDEVAKLAHAMGIGSTLPLVPALALGAGAVTPIELTTAYAPFGNGGVRVTPYAVERVEDVFGRVLWQHPSHPTPRVLAATDAFLVTSLLRSVVDDGTGRSVRAAGVRGPVAGKTGTTNDGADVWFVGFTPTLVASVWFGADEPRPLGNGATGGRLAAPVWARFVKEGWHNPETDTAWVPPVGVEARQIDLASGQIAAAWCGPSRTAWFRTGSAPTATCNGRESGITVAMRDIEALVDDARDVFDARPMPPATPPRAPSARSPRPPRAPSPDVRQNTDDHRFRTAVGTLLRVIAHTSSTTGRDLSHKIRNELRKANAERVRAQRRLAER